jgi:ribosome-associated protein
MTEDGQDNAEQTTAPLSDAELLAQCDVDTFRSGGPGGQHQNVTDSGVRLRHRPSGIVVTCRRTRSQYLNKQECLARLRRRLEERERPVTPRVPTRPSRGSQERRLQEKARRAALKRERGAQPENE